jgi:hypothetical protein
MADKTIGQLTAAGTLTGAELVEVEQGGNSRQTTVDKIGDRLPARSKEWVGQHSLVKDLTIDGSGNVDWTLADANVFRLLNVGQNFHMNLPSDIATMVGFSGLLIISQNGTGGYDMTVDAGILPLNATTLFEIVQAANGVTIIAFIVASATQIGFSASGLGVEL